MHSPKPMQYKSFITYICRLKIGHIFSNRLSHNVFPTTSFSQRLFHYVFLTTSISQRIFTTSFSQRLSYNELLTTSISRRLSLKVFLTTLVSRFCISYSSAQHSPHKITNNHYLCYMFRLPQFRPIFNRQTRHALA